ncbi:MAG: beta-ketoacyl synthase N-terminal-like domain-containing protein [Leptolyngbya sp. IPPAS B-1204]
MVGSNQFLAALSPTEPQAMEPSANSADLSPTKRALLALQQLQAKLDALEAAQQEPIAIVGMGCRFPGNVENPADFWQLLQAQQDAITEVPNDRWDLSKYYHPDPNHPGTMHSRLGGFLPHLLEFDAAFFRIAPREAASLDPQQRLLLEVSWEAVEHAGLAADRLVGSNTGVFVGICSIDYWQRLLNRHPSEIDAYLTTGNTHSLAAGRISYVFGFTGPSLALDTACSSSLVAVHTACQSLRQRECDLALAGGVNRILEPASSINFAKARMMSISGRCRSFDAAADGFVRAEGAGIVVLKRWRDAVRDGDRVWAVILGSAVNHDGRAGGLTVPNGSAQQALLRQALQQSRIQPAQVSYIETHGTGTPLGDPIEMNAIGAVLTDSRPQPLYLGAVKTNIGHTEAAAGIAGLIKTVLALQAEAIPANLHFQTPNPQIPWAELPVQVPTQLVPWPQGTMPRVAGISAFGFSGTNAHIIVADRPPESSNSVSPDSSRQSAELANPPYLLTLSARTEPALQQLVERYRQHLQTHSSISLADLCYTANQGRAQFNHRLAILADSLPDLQQKLAQIGTGSLPSGVFQGRVTQPVLSLTDDTAFPDLPSLAQHYVAGACINWTARGHTVVLPTYPFQRQHYGIEPT